MVNIKFPDGKTIEYPDGVTPFAIAEKISRKLAKSAVCARVNGILTDITTPLSGDVELNILTDDTPEGLEVIRHSTSHVMAEAVKRLYPQAKLAIGPSIEDGFYYDFDVAEPFVPEDLPKIEKEMAGIIAEKKPFVRIEMERGKAIEMMKSKDEPYKVELLSEIKDDKISLYKQGDFTDLCRGPHIPNTGKVPFFKILKATGAYWRGNERGKMLQRIYGTAFATKEALAEYLNHLEEVKKRDHRRLGKDLDLFSTHEEAGAGLIFWHPRGAMIRYLAEEFWKKEHLRHGYQLLNTPHIAKDSLWKISGHLDFYRESMYASMDVDGMKYHVKPMNCPGHILVYKTKVRSYRDLPIRWAELGTVYRYERPGVLHGLLRVRGFTQDDAHIFCEPSKIDEEVLRTTKFAIHILNSFGFSEFDVSIGTMPEKYIGSPDIWKKAINALENALKIIGISYTMEEGGGAFYGPKIDIKIKDSLKRAWQCSTIQVDFNLPERFDIVYAAADGTLQRPIMIHRALVGSLERFFGILIEHYGGAFPMWLAPVQVIIASISEGNVAYAEKLAEQFRSEDVRVETDVRNERISLKIRDAIAEKVPYILIVGEREEQNNMVSVRERNKGDTGQVPVQDFLKKIREESIFRKG
ncbi:MAG: threonine--tRNA ligase [Planctomycetes bacterium]|nr:threonine--tRNA ligase [Planctomycetota bacterium]